MNPLVSNIGVMLLSNYICKKLDMTDPVIINYLRIFYITTNVLTYLIYNYIKLQIKKKNNLKTIKYQHQKSAMEMLMKGGAAAAEGNEEPVITKTIVEYDLEQVETLIKGMYTSWMMMAGMHLYMKYTQPMVMQGISPIKSVFEHDLFKAYIMGQEVERPFGQQAAAAPKEDSKKPKKKLPAAKKE
ncbi:hypothetical protein ACO0SA_003625 [Hanseniaspora valbyensis]